jgi:hypothetical protein
VSDKDIRGRDVLAALPDLALGVTFLVTWVAPTAFGERMVARLVLLMLLEFLIVHSSAIMGVQLVAPTPTRRKLTATLGLAAFYTLFVGSFSLMFRRWWPLFVFWGLTLNRLLGALLGGAPTGAEKRYVKMWWGLSAACYVGFAMATAFLPWLRLGITREVVAAQELPGSGLWIERPHRAIAFGFLYFTTMGILQLFGTRLTARLRREPLAADT